MSGIWRNCSSFKKPRGNTLHLERSRAQRWLSSDLLKFNKQGRSRRSISFCQGCFSPIININTSLKRVVPFAFSSLQITLGLLVRRRNLIKLKEKKQGLEKKRQREDMEVQKETDEDRSGQRRSKSNGSLFISPLWTLSAVLTANSANGSAETEPKQLRCSFTPNHDVTPTPN